jgi:3-hydroxybutyryl-CoA dehydrogenase
MKVVVVGSGYMGRGIAQTLVLGGATVVLVDQTAEIAESSFSKLLDEVATAEKNGLIPSGSTTRVTKNASHARSFEEGVGNSDLVMEAVFEDREVKEKTLKEIEKFASPTTVIGTNTSAIPISDLAKVLKHPNRFFGIHWYNPAPYLPGIEIILGSESDSKLLIPVLDLLRSAGKDPVEVSDSPGFVANRLQFALFKEAALMVEEGLATPSQIDAVVRSAFGFRLPFFGPFAIADMAGLDVYSNSYKTLAATLGPRFEVPASLAKMVSEGDLGVKSGGGYLRMAKEEVAEILGLRDRSYVALDKLRKDLGFS